MVQKDFSDSGLPLYVQNDNYLIQVNYYLAFDVSVSPETITYFHSCKSRSDRIYRPSLSGQPSTMNAGSFLRSQSLACRGQLAVLSGPIHCSSI